MLRHPRRTLLAILTTTLLLGSLAMAQGGERVPAAAFGEPFPEGTVNARVDARLLAYARAALRFEPPR